MTIYELGALWLTFTFIAGYLGSKGGNYHYYSLSFAMASFILLLLTGLSALNGGAL